MRWIKKWLYAIMNRNQKISSYFSDGTQTVYEYSPSGNLLHVTGETGTISYSYNKAGLLVSQVDHGAGETADICLGVTATYDLNNQKSSGLPNSWGFGSVGAVYGKQKQS